MLIEVPEVSEAGVIGAPGELLIEKAVAFPIFREVIDDPGIIFTRQSRPTP
ncbi:MAG TPA: hypothetical protein VIA07_00750 [Desulfuromonadales bacterium]|jgi:hypothetical protein